MDFSARQRRRHTAISYIVLGAALAVFVLQLRSLYVVPIPDSVRWGGDETWLMREFGNQARHGAMAYPENFGAPQRTDGLLAGSMWVNAFIYGVPGNLFSPAFDLVTIGRTVTAVLSLLLIISLYVILRKLRIDPVLASCVVALLVISQGFAWATHCARYDILTGITLLWYVYFLARSAHRILRAQDAFIFGTLSILLLIFSRHLLTLAVGPTVALLFVTHLWQQRHLLLRWVAGFVSGFALLSLSYWLGAGEFSLFGRGGALGSYSFVLQQIPIARPFSRSVQVANLLERFNLFATDSPGVLLTFLCVVIILVLYTIWRSRMKGQGKVLRVARTPEQFFVAIAASLSLICWLLFQGSRPYYLFHIVPVLCVATAIILQIFSEVHEAKWFGKAIPLLIIIVGIVLQANHAIPATAFGKAVQVDQRAAISDLLAHARPNSRVLVDVAGLDRALQDRSHQVLTLDMFQPPAVAEEAVRKLRANRIDFVILRSSPVGERFEPGRALLPHLLDSIGEPRDTVMGFFYDDGRSYDASLTTLIDQGLDTLKLYQVSH